MPIIKGWKFPIDINKKTGRIETVCDNETVKQSVNMILKTQIMERKVVSFYGSELRSFMFGIVDSNYISSFKKSIKTAIEKWEDHVKTIKIGVRAAGGPVSRVEAEVEYTTDISPEIERVTKRISMSDTK
ncbi:MAG: GPW/gp25 family protein [Oscillospiraceae bacterium]|jgi:phage baseplate assembly protein W|nr:GPW/gp25 family protein [Oscillospiraceae bacterium]